MLQGSILETKTLSFPLLWILISRPWYVDTWSSRSLFSFASPIGHLCYPANYFNIPILSSYFLLHIFALFFLGPIYNSWYFQPRGSIFRFNRPLPVALCCSAAANLKDVLLPELLVAGLLLDVTLLQSQVVHETHLTLIPGHLLPVEISSYKSHGWVGIDIGLYIVNIRNWAFHSDIGSFWYLTERWYQMSDWLIQYKFSRYRI